MTTATAARPRPAAAPGHRAEGGALTGIGTVVRHMLRLERVRLPLWIIILAVMLVGTAASLPGLYPDAASRAGAAVTINNPGTTALVGAIYDADSYTYGVMMGHETVAISVVIAALMSIFTLVRHTRGEEETGRAELVRSSVVGRHATAVGAALVVVLANVVLALVLAAGMALLGVESIDWGGSLLYGAAIAAGGLVFAGVAAVTVQLTEHARTASSLAGLVLAVAFAVRAAGDVAGSTLTWFSPIGWSQKTYVYGAEERWWPLALSLAAAVLLVALAVPLSRRRDVGAGILPQRTGRPEASRFLAGPLGLAWRQSRTSFIGWGIAVLVFGASYGPVLGDADSFLDQMEIMGEFLPDIGGASGAELFASVVLGIAAILCSVPAVQTVTRLRGEETAGRAEPLLATALSRPRWLGSNLLVGLLGGAVLLVLFGLGFGSTAAQATGDPALFGAIMRGAITYLPALAVLVGVATAAYGLASRAVGIVWALLGFSVIVLYFGELLSFPEWLRNVSPFQHVPAVPAVDAEPGPLVGLAVVAVVLIVIGLVGIRRRDITTA